MWKGLAMLSSSGEFNAARILATLLSFLKSPKMQQLALTQLNQFGAAMERAQVHDAVSTQCVHFHPALGCFEVCSVGLRMSVEFISFQQYLLDVHCLWSGSDFQLSFFQTCFDKDPNSLF